MIDQKGPPIPLSITGHWKIIHGDMFPEWPLVIIANIYNNTAVAFSLLLQRTQEETHTGREEGLLGLTVSGHSSP